MSKTQLKIDKIGTRDLTILWAKKVVFWTFWKLFWRCSEVVWALFSALKCPLLAVFSARKVDIWPLKSKFWVKIWPPERVILTILIWTGAEGVKQGRRCRRSQLSDLCPSPLGSHSALLNFGQGVASQCGCLLAWDSDTVTVPIQIPERKKSDYKIDNFEFKQNTASSSIVKHM